MSVAILKPQQLCLKAALQGLKPFAVAEWKIATSWAATNHISESAFSFVQRAASSANGTVQ